MESKLVTSSIAVRCRKLSFSFNSGEPVLSDLSMTVPRASFYCLLGASSCGKTTLLKIIIGTFKAINGEVEIFGRPIGSRGCLVPGHSVGYMPQTLCFPAYFSIETILYYFAQINQVPCSQINDRIKTMIECFDLPDIKRNVADLSGGQKRRLSLAIALIHLPALLILDEPTVGVDPLLRCKIIKYLRQLCIDGHTVILTTHYTEDTVSSDLVAYMRNGRLICELNPRKLMTLAGALDLEKAFYFICSQQDLTGQISPKMLQIYNRPNKEEMLNSESLIEKCPYFSGIGLHQFSIVFRRTCVTLLTDWSTLLNLFIIPHISLFLFYLSRYKLTTSQSIGVIVDGQQNVCSDQYNIADDFVKTISHLTTNVNLLNSSQLAHSMYSRETTAAIYFPANITECLIRYLNNQDNDKSMFAGMGQMAECDVPIRVLSSINYLDDFYWVSYMFTKAYHEVVYRFISNFSALNPQSFKLPINVFIDNDIPILEGNVTDKLNNVGVSNLYIYYIPMLISGLFWIKERQSGIMSRSKVHNVCPFNYFLSQLVILSTLCCISNMFYLMAVIYVFNIPNSFNNLSVLLINSLLAVNWILIGQFGAFVFDTQSRFMMFIAVLTGLVPYLDSSMWPFESLPWLLQLMAYITPNIWCNYAVRAILIKNLTLAYSAVYNAIIVLIVNISFMFTISAVVLQYNVVP